MAVRLRRLIRLIAAVLVTVLMSVLLMTAKRAYQSSAMSRMQKTYWTTVVGVTKDDSLADITGAFSRRHLVDLRAIPSSCHFTEHVLKLDSATAHHFDEVVVAIYDKDPHFNWGRAHLLHQAPMKGSDLVWASPAFVTCSIDIDDLYEENALGERSLLIVKPDLAKDEDIISGIRSRLLESDFRILHERSLVLTPDTAKQFYSEHQNKSFFDPLISYMTGGPLYTMIVEHRKQPDTIAALRVLVGPTDPNVARKDNPASLRAIYGQSLDFNGIHASDSFDAVARELQIIYTPSPSHN